MPRLDARSARKPNPRPKTGGNRSSRLLVLVCALLFPLFPVISSAEPPPELHVLIDVSGSMKETDPDNLRGPALRLLADLVSERSRVRVDLFGDQVSNLLSAATADADTRRAMRHVAGQIRSDEPFTDIPAALEAADRGWADPVQRHVILLSDGKVDVSRETGDNESAMAFLRDEVIPSLVESGVQVHTVALSEFADTDMLAEIADRTGGLAISARSSADLQRAFLALFEATAPRTGLPLTDNRIQVDDSVRELTLVIFRQPDAAPSRIKLPDGREVDVERAKRMDDWRWDDSAGRDLITITRPSPGTWHIQAREDPDNRALVITDLDLAMPDIPGRVHPGEIIEGYLVLTDRGEPIIEPRLSDDMTATIRIVDPTGDMADRIVLNDRAMGDDEARRDGRYG
ncbi:VWA domain-containing protein, partial [Guyparkeria sp.]|uniref:VWA domain-containing protein n=1 Tax=Guyparkeria sp. TaxID=2035736 RepID=UPI0035694A03